MRSAALFQPWVSRGCSWFEDRAPDSHDKNTCGSSFTSHNLFDQLACLSPCCGPGAVGTRCYRDCCFCKYQFNYKRFPYLIVSIRTIEQGPELMAFYLSFRIPYPERGGLKFPSPGGVPEGRGGRRPTGGVVCLNICPRPSPLAPRLLPFSFCCKTDIPPPQSSKIHLS